MRDAFAETPHHPADEGVTVISGALCVAMGNNTGKGEKRGVGGFAVPPARTILYARTPGKTVVRVEAEAPFGMTYVAPADDPTKKQQG
jgi:hypothetical protein